MSFKLVESRKLVVEVYEGREDVGKAAAMCVSGSVRELLTKERKINMVFAAAPSQNEFLDALVTTSEIDWARIQAFHLDEYIGLRRDAPQLFKNFLAKRLFSRVPFHRVYYIDQDDGASPEEMCARYSEWLRQNPLHIACIGIGENGHIAFNEPSVADFDDPHLVKVVELEEASRRQQVNDGCFASLAEVPTHAITLTIPAIMSAQKIVCIVPGSQKSYPVWKTLEGPVTTECPASILRRHPDVSFFLDRESASLILKGGG